MEAKMIPARGLVEKEIGLVPRTPIAIAATGVTFNLALEDICGVATRYILEIPNYTTGSPTTTLSIINANGVTIYTGPAFTEYANYSIPIDIELIGDYTVRLTLSGAAGAETVVYFTMFLS